MSDKKPDPKKRRLFSFLTDKEEAGELGVSLGDRRVNCGVMTNDLRTNKWTKCKPTCSRRWRTSTKWKRKCKR